MKQKVIKAGNSLAVTIPSKFKKSIGIKVGDEVDVCLDQENGIFSCTFKGAHQLSIQSLSK